VKFSALLLFALLSALSAVAGTPQAPGPFEGRVYQVDTIYNNIDVFVDGRKTTFWANDATKVKVHRKRAQLIDIAMGDQVRGTYVTGAKGARILVTIEDVSGH